MIPSFVKSPSDNGVVRFKNRLSGVLGLFLTACCTLFLMSAPANAQEWELVWSDEFEGDELNLDNWSYQTGRGANYGLQPGWGNNELQWYTDSEDNIFVQDGKLHIRALEDADRDYTSARIRSFEKAEWTYGRFEARAKLPAGQGLWPAIWMLPTDEVYGGWPESGEIDILEAKGHQETTVYGSVHYGAPWPNNQFRTGTYELEDSNLTEEFHVFAIEWEPGIIRFYVDDTLYYLVTPANLNPFNWPFDQDFHWLLNVAVGGNFSGNPDETTEFPQEMIVDYVRVYEDATLTSAGDEDLHLPDEYALDQNYPNPFNPTTKIDFSIPQNQHVTLEVYNVMGQRVATLVDQDMQAGTHTASFDARGLASGVYMYRLNAGGEVLERRMSFIK